MNTTAKVRHWRASLLASALLIFSASREVEPRPPVQLPVTRSGSLNLKLDPLRQWKIQRIIDRVGRAAHVRLPTVRARFAASAGRLLTSEGSADFGTTGSYIDIHDAAV